MNGAGKCKNLFTRGESSWQLLAGSCLVVVGVIDGSLSPAPIPMGIIVTALLGIAGSFVGGFLGHVIKGGGHRFCWPRRLARLGSPCNHPAHRLHFFTRPKPSSSSSPHRPGLPNDVMHPRKFAPLLFALIATIVASGAITWGCDGMQPRLPADSTVALDGSAQFKTVQAPVDAAHRLAPHHSQSTSPPAL